LVESTRFFASTRDDAAVAFEISLAGRAKPAGRLHEVVAL